MVRSTNMYRYVLSFAVVGLTTGFVAAGCGTDTKTQSSTGSTSQSVPLEQASAEMAKVFCGIAFTCCDMTELADVMGDFNPPPKTQAECEVAVKPVADAEIFGKLKEAVNAGRLAYDADKAGLCFAKIDGRCGNLKDGIFVSDAECQSVFTGKVAAGGTCAQDLECADASSMCAGAMGGSTVGKCGPLPKENEACPDYRCAAGLACETGATMNKCIKPKADGMTCGSNTECTSEYCDFSTMKCSAPQAVGKACSSNSGCIDGWCDTLNGNTCKAKKALGETCALPEECISDACDAMDKCGTPFCDGK